jgi:hypothetical protein
MNLFWFVMSGENALLRNGPFVLLFVISLMVGTGLYKTCPSHNVLAHFIVLLNDGR